MDALQAELRDDYPILNIQIVGINEFGQDPPGANDLATTNRTTPWLQDGDSDGNQNSDVWESWGAIWRDVTILDGQNEAVDVYNLTTNDLGASANYATMRDKLIGAAMTEQKPWQNHRDRFDINDDGFVVPFDVLIMINEINDSGPRTLPPPTGTTLAAPYWDCSGDNFLSPVDVLQVINFIEEANAEGEAPGELPQGGTTLIAALPTAEPLSTTELDSITTTTVEPAPANYIAPATPALVAQSDDSKSEPFQVTGLDEDDFWADYWPNL